jgi:hypothetical protein
MSEYVCDACGSAIMDDGDCLCTADYRAPKSLSRWGSLANLWSKGLRPIGLL